LDVYSVAERGALVLVEQACRGGGYVLMFEIKAVSLSSPTQNFTIQAQGERFPGLHKLMLFRQLRYLEIWSSMYDRNLSHLQRLGRPHSPPTTKSQQLAPRHEDPLARFANGHHGAQNGSVIPILQIRP